MLLRKILAAGVVGITCVSNFCFAYAANIEVRDLKDGQNIHISGTFKEGDDDKFTRALLESKNPNVSFDSPGGNLLVGFAIGNAIRLRNVNVFVVDEAMCASACALAWLGGTHRVIIGPGRVGFHAAYNVGKDGQQIEKGAANALVGSYLSKLGLNDKAIFYITNSAPAEMQWLTKADADRYGIQVEFVNSPNVGADALPPAQAPQITTAPISPQIPAPPSPPAPAPSGPPPNLAPTPFPQQQTTIAPAPVAPVAPAAPPVPAPTQALPRCYVDDVRPPDAWLALRSEPSDKRGKQLMKLYPGQSFEMLGTNQGDWHEVRGPDNRIGWVSWKEGRWISCPGQRP